MESNVRKIAIVLVFAATTGCGSMQESNGAGMPEPSSGETPCATTVKLVDFKLVPADIEVDSGHVEICVENDGKTPHDLAIRDERGNDLDRTPTLSQGETSRLSADLTAGKYGIYCAEPGHDSLGMHGTLTAR